MNKTDHNTEKIASRFPDPILYPTLQASLGALVVILLLIWLLSLGGMDALSSWLQSSGL